MLVGSGGANDIASAAAEVVVLTRCSPARMVPEVDYITSPGRAVRHVVTGACVFERQGDAPRWRVGDVYPLHGGRPLAEVLETIRASCPWDFEAPEGLQYAPVISTAELKLLYLLDPDGDHWEREPARAASWQ
jgi:acyl CoA:acetate/3-ketoacid CoA transferase beta subunit